MSGMIESSWIPQPMTAERDVKAQEVLILAPHDDIHAQVVAHVLASDFDIAAPIWSFDQFQELNSRFDIGADRASLFLNNQEVGSFRSVWWRRPGNFKISPAITDTEVQKFCA